MKPNFLNPADIAQQLMATVGEAVAKTAMTKPPTLSWDPAWEIVRFVEESGRPMRMYAGDTWIDRVTRSSE